MGRLFVNNSGYTLGGALVNNEETPVKATRALVPGEAVFSEHPLVTLHPVDGVTFEGKPIRDWIMLFQQIEASVIGKTKWATPLEKKPDTAYMDMAREQERNPAGNALRPYRAPKLGKAGVTVAQAGKVRGGVDAELAAAGWRPYRDPRKETA
jgi:hypothetical protein